MWFVDKQNEVKNFHVDIWQGLKRATTILDYVYTSRVDRGGSQPTNSNLYKIKISLSGIVHLMVDECLICARIQCYLCFNVRQAY